MTVWIWDVYGHHKGTKEKARKLGYTEAQNASGAKSQFRRDYGSNFVVTSVKKSFPRNKPFALRG